MAVARGGGPRWTGSTDRGGGSAPRIADVAPTQRPRGSHAGGHTDGPEVDRREVGARGWRAWTAQAGPVAMAHGGTTAGRRRRTAASDGERRRTASDGERQRTASDGERRRTASDGDAAPSGKGGDAKRERGKMTGRCSPRVRPAWRGDGERRRATASGNCERRTVPGITKRTR
uniref:Uncharacterized protein n=1 Tax=Oryza sativa subsp. japonica TaxID=39947 RepID=Q6K6N3_ORYSJ|nr:hypothetical protein [Oryza sativa Japonica Group]